mgnify:CR=1 FL=1
MSKIYKWTSGKNTAFISLTYLFISLYSVIAIYFLYNTLTRIYERNFSDLGWHVGLNIFLVVFLIIHWKGSKGKNNAGDVSIRMHFIASFFCFCFGFFTAWRINWHDLSFFSIIPITFYFSISDDLLFASNQGAFLNRQVQGCFKIPIAIGFGIEVTGCMGICL